jgi:hypothetical protein
LPSQLDMAIQHPDLGESGAFPHLSNGFPLEEDYWEVVVLVKEEMGSQMAQDVHGLLTHWYWDILAEVNARLGSQNDWYLLADQYTDDEYWRAVRESAFEHLALPTIGRKGTRSPRD